MDVSMAQVYPSAIPTMGPIPEAPAIPSELGCAAGAFTLRSEAISADSNRARPNIHKGFPRVAFCRSFQSLLAPGWSPGPPWLGRSVGILIGLAARQ